ncbi:hypothetical protein ZHAS_00021289 [Anopheles sinensis]|uniref:Uncharacterized protein n=1 Tax=Anopheles sinensis TaxID=74873 RepID=A0A084WS02_ANOSI|nr:hypothetical protein ZHAS_00021289 [Anopheles sinensis]
MAGIRNSVRVIRNPKTETCPGGIFPFIQNAPWYRRPPWERTEPYFVPSSAPLRPIHRPFREGGLSGKAAFTRLLAPKQNQALVF